jgi:ferredoxin-NADP reductase
MWPSYRKFTIQSVVEESESAKSFILIPVDGGPLASYLPGQHLPLRIQIAGQSRPVIRCYTLSDCFNERHYRLTIKKELPPPNRENIPPGLSSTHFHESLHAGDVIEAKAPSGKFHLDPNLNHPVVMLAGGIGVTPIISMINGLCQAGSDREVYFIFALRHGGDHVFKKYLRSATARFPNIHMCVLYENPRSQDAAGQDYDRIGRIDIALLQEILPSLDMEYYVCGPSGMMDSISEALMNEGVPREMIRTESFGPSSLSFRSALADEEKDAHADILPELTVTFAKSGKAVLWRRDAATLLEFAEMNGVDISFGCRYGDCGTCLTRLLRGRVQYLHPTDVRPDPGTCLPCSCKPETAIELDA